jgi:alpha-galactosidase
MDVTMARFMTRRDLLRLAASAPMVALAPRQTLVPSRAGSLDIEAFSRASWRVTGAGGTGAPSTIRLTRAWEGTRCHLELANKGSEPIALAEAVLFDVGHALPANTPLYGEGFQMLSQTGGTLGAIADLGNYTDAAHYKMAEPAGARVVYNLLTIDRGNGSGTEYSPAAHHVLAFTSCRRFSGQFRLRPGRIEAVVDLEGLTLAPGERWELEEFWFSTGEDREALLDAVASRLAVHHKPLSFPAPPSGWCSWYCFGPKVTAGQVLDNLAVIARDIPGLRYIQIDDGYQPAMGDWLDTGAAFGGEVQTVLRQIRDRGFEPAIWVAPFIAEDGSALFKQHPGWFVKDGAGAPLRADRVTFGGWRRGPWYALDGTHPEAQAHLERVFRTMRDHWGCTYFKLDANFWGAIHGGHFHDSQASRIEAYRRGMAAVLRGTRDAFVLGCNHPIWPSIGVVHGSRSSNDIRRDWKRVSDTARQNLSRNWQNGRLWWNDPDAVVLTGSLTEDEFCFHATAIFASGGMILSGDDLTTIAPTRMAVLKKLQPPTGRAATFADTSMNVGVVDLPGGQAFCLLNWSDGPREVEFTLSRRHHAQDYWTDADLGSLSAGRHAFILAPHSGRVVMCTPAV